MARTRVTTGEEVVLTDNQYAGSTEAPEDVCQTQAESVSVGLATNSIEPEEPCQEPEVDCVELVKELDSLLRGKPEDKYTLIPAEKASTNQTVRRTGVMSQDCKYELCEKLL